VVHLRGAQVDSERGGLPSGQDLALKAEAWKSPGLFGVAEKR
jgi:L-lactate dehydrogenase complex protein LldF